MTADDAPIFSRAEVTAGMPARRASTLLYAIESAHGPPRLPRPPGDGPVRDRADRGRSRGPVPERPRRGPQPADSGRPSRTSTDTRIAGRASCRRSLRSGPRSSAGSSRSTACRSRLAGSGPRSEPTTRRSPRRTARRTGVDGRRRPACAPLSVARAPAMATRRHLAPARVAAAVLAGVHADPHRDRRRRRPRPADRAGRVRPGRRHDPAGRLRRPQRADHRRAGREHHPRRADALRERVPRPAHRGLPRTTGARHRRPDAVRPRRGRVQRRADRLRLDAGRRDRRVRPHLGRRPLRGRDGDPVARVPSMRRSRSRSRSARSTSSCCWSSRRIAFANARPDAFAVGAGTGIAFDATFLELVFGVALVAYFGHTSAGHSAKVVLARDPSGRASPCGERRRDALGDGHLHRLRPRPDRGRRRGRAGGIRRARRSRRSPQRVGPIIDVLGHDLHRPRRRPRARSTSGSGSSTRWPTCWPPCPGAAVEPATAVPRRLVDFAIRAAPLALIFVVVEVLLVARLGLVHRATEPGRDPDPAPAERGLPDAPAASPPGVAATGCPAG